MFEVVNTETRESEGYFRSYSEAIEFALTANESCELWKVADDDIRTRVQLVGTPS